MKSLLTLQECSGVFQKAYLHGGAVAVAAFLAGAFGLSLVFLLFLLALLLLALGTLYNGLERTQEMKEAANTRNISMATIPKDGETTEWLCHTLIRIWTAYCARMESRLTVQLQQFLDYNKPGWVDSFSTQELQLGAVAPQIHHVWVMTPQRASNVEMDLLADVTILLPDLQWNVTAILHPVKVNVPLQVRDLLLKGKMMFKLRFQNKKPYVEKMWLSFAGQPDFRFSIKVLNLLQMNDVPVLRTFLDNLIRDSLKNNMVHPHRWLIDVDQIWHRDNVDAQHIADEPVAIIVAHLPAPPMSMKSGAASSPNWLNTPSFRSCSEQAFDSEYTDSSAEDSCEDDVSPETILPTKKHLIYSLKRQNTRLNLWLSSHTGSDQRTLLLRHFNDEVKLVLRGAHHTGQSEWSIEKVFDAKELLSGPYSVNFNIKGRKLTAEVKIYHLQPPGPEGGSFDSPLPVVPDTLSMPPQPASPLQLSGADLQPSVSKHSNLNSPDNDNRNLRKKIDVKMSNIMSMVRSREGNKTTALTSFIPRARQILNSISIPSKVYSNARGIALMSVYKVGLVLGVRSGAGILVVRDDEGWSAPSALWLGGMSAGLEGGAQTVDIAIVINGDEGLEAFCGSVLVLGSDITLLPGPVTDEEVGNCQDAPLFCYTHNKGVFLGLSLRGTVITEHRVLNRRFYGRNMRTPEILQSKSLRDLPDVQALHVVLENSGTRSGDDKDSPRKSFDDIYLPDWSGEVGGLVRFSIVTVADVSLPETAQLSCLIHRDARLVGQCKLDRQGPGNWSFSTAASATVDMVVHDAAKCILQLTVVSDIDGHWQVVGSTAMDVYTCLNSVEGPDGKIVLLLGPSMAAEDATSSRHLGDLEQHNSMQSLDQDSGVSPCSSTENTLAAIRSTENTLTAIRSMSSELSVINDDDESGFSDTESVISIIPGKYGSGAQHDADTARSYTGSISHRRVSKYADTEACANHTAHTAEWLYSFVHQCNLCRDFKHHLRTIPSCFMGRELVDQLRVTGHFPDRHSAVAFVQHLMPTQTDDGAIHPVNSEVSIFEDKKVFYRFFADEMNGVSKGGKEKYNIPGFSHDESTSVHWQKWVSRRDGEAAEGKSDKLLWRSLEAAKEIIKRNRKKSGNFMIPQVHCTITFSPAEHLADDLGDLGALYDDFSPYIASDDNVLPTQYSPEIKNSAALPFFRFPAESVVSPGGQPVLESAASLQTASTAQDQVLCLTVVIKQARNLQGRGGLCDAYVKVRIEDEKIYRTKTIKKTAAPVWDEEFKIKMISRLNGTVEFQVKDWNPISDDTALGKATLYLDSYFGQQEVKGLISKTVHLPLSNAMKKPCPGQLTLRLTAQPGII